MRPIIQAGTMRRAFRMQPIYQGDREDVGQVANPSLRSNPLTAVSKSFKGRALKKESGGGKA